VYYSRLNKGANGGTPNVDLSSSLAMSAEYSSISVSPDGENIFVVLETSRGLMTSESTNGGESFDGNELDPLVQRNASPFSVWTSTRGHFFGWQATRGETFDVAYGATITSVNDEILNEYVLVVKTDDGIRVSSPGTINRVSVYDLMGRLISADAGEGRNVLAVINPNAASTGVLIVYVQLANGQAVSRVITAGI
jgi:hypothetical protein